MQITAAPSIAFVLSGLLALTAWTGCDGCSNAGQEEQLPWRVISEEAGYELIFPGTWAADSPASINAHADIAAHRDDTFFFLVIPQELPDFPKPDVFELQQAGMEMLDESLEDLVIERQGPLELDGVSGLTVFARGVLDGESIHYITSYAIHDDIGYQIIAFTDEDHATKLFRDTDTILSNWTFIDDSTDGETTLDSVESEEEPTPSGALPDLEEPEEPE